MNIFGIFTTPPSAASISPFTPDFVTSKAFSCLVRSSCAICLFDEKQVVRENKYRLLFVEPVKL